MLLSFRPLISVSVLSLLGWCWYSFRRKRTRSPLLTKEEVYFHDGSNPVPCSPTDSCVLEESNLKVDHGISTSSEMSKSMKALSVLLNSEPVLDILNLTSTSPVIGLTEGVRPEPEGQVSFRFPENLKTQKEIDNITVLEHLDASENDSGLESDPICASSSCLSTDSHPLVGLEPHPSRIEGPDVSSLSDLFPNEDLNLDDMEEISSRLVRQVINAAAEEWNQENLEPRDLCEPAGVSRPLEDGLKSTAQDLFPQQGISEASSELPSPLSYRPLSTSTWSDPVNDPSWLGNNSSSESHQDAGSFSDKILGHVGVSVGDDSGCSFCYLEDKSGVEETTSEITRGQSFLMTPTRPDTSGTESEEVPSILGVAEPKDEACREISSPDSGVKSLNRANADTQLSCTSLAPPPAPPIIQWDIEVPAHLVGRLIGKQGKFVNHLKQSSGAKIYVSTLPFTQDVQICHIQGSQQQVDEALSLIRKKFKDLDLSNCVPMPCLPITSWLLLPQDVFVEVIVSQVEAGHHLFVLQHKHPSYQTLPTLIQHMQLCYSQPGCPSLPTPVEVGVVCAALVTGSGWQRAQVIQYHSETDTAHIRYVDDGGYANVNSATLRQIRSDFVSLPFQAAEVLLDNITPLPGEEEFSLEAKAALEELTANVALILQVTGCQDGLPLVHLWKQTGDEVVLVNRLLVDRGVCSWIETQ